MKHILVLDTGREWGGGTNSLLELLRRTDKKKFRFTALFYHNYKKPGESDIRTEIKKLGIDFLLLERNPRPVAAKFLKETARALFFFSRKLRKRCIFRVDYIFRVAKDACHIERLIKGLGVDMLYMNNQPSTNLEGIIASDRAGVASVLHSRIETELNAFEIDAVNRRLTKMICVSKGVMEDFVRQGIEPSKCIVVHNGIDSGIRPSVPPENIRRDLGIRDDDIVIGSAGSLIKRKRFGDLIKAISELGRQNPDNGIPPLTKGGKGGFFGNIRCLIIGEGPEREALQKEIQKNKLDGIVTLAGFQPDAVSYINAMDVFVLPSEREGLPRVILEAMLTGKPVVASRITGPTELVTDGDTGFLFRTGDIKDLAGRLSELISSSRLRKKMGEAGRKKVEENFSIEKYVSEVSRVLEGVSG